MGTHILQNSLDDLPFGARFRYERSADGFRLSLQTAVPRIHFPAAKTWAFMAANWIGRSVCNNLSTGDI